MAAIAATLLCYYPDDIAFVMLVRLWQDKGLQNFFSPEFDGLMSAFKVLEDALSQRAVGKKLVIFTTIAPDFRRIYRFLHQVMRPDGTLPCSIILFHFTLNYEFGMP